MRKFLPFLFLLILLVSFLNSPFSVFAQDSNTNSSSPDNTWQVDSEVTYVGKMGARAGAFLNWELAPEGSKWYHAAPGAENSLAIFWITIRNIVYAFLILFVLITAFVIIITQGRSITIRRFLPRFIAMVVLITFSFSLIQFIYQIADVIQQFFLKNSAGAPISQADLLNIGFDYKNFVGYRLTGAINDESAFISLLLIKLTAITYYVMTGILILRKIILWFFIIVSPIFPLLLLYMPIRNTAKIWIGEFFRWVLYAPLFALFLGGLVSIWSSRTGIPLFFNNFAGVGTNVIYPTAINILLGGPGQALSVKNSINLTETFALYIVSLMMLWAVIILPFILLKIFLDYFQAYSFSNNSFAKQLLSLSTGLFKTGPPPFSPSPVSPSPYRSTGSARSIPFSHTVSIPTAQSVSQTNINSVSSAFSRPSMTSQVYNQPIQRINVQNTEILKMANLTVPTLHDIARYDTSFTSSKISEHQEVSRIHETLERIASPTMVASPLDRQKYTQIKESLQVEKQKGNPIAAGVLSAAQATSKTTALESSSIVEKVSTTQFKEFLQKIENPTTISSISEREEYTNLKNQLTTQSQKGDTVATSILTTAHDTTHQDETTITKLKGEIMAAKDKESSSSVVKQLAKASGQQVAVVSIQASLPAVNNVQTVSFDDYESVKKLWQENYEKQDVPKGIKGEDRTREEWIKTDMDKITNTINLLSSADPQKVKEGMASVSHILPFLLIGGFSQSEVIAYLKAKEEAAKTVLETSKKKQEEEETLLTTEKKEETAKGQMHEAVEIKEENPKQEQNNNF